MSSEIIIRGARLHNLKNVSLSIPKNKLVVITGLSGSGKSTLAFDILHKEGQRQYLESLGLIPYGLARPLVDSITGLSPTISINQNISNRSPRSTVGTVSDIYTYLRILFARLGHRPCPRCGKDLPPVFQADVDYDSSTVVDDELESPATRYFCPHCSGSVVDLSMASFSFNKPEGACPTCTGLGTIQKADLGSIVDETKSIQDGAVIGWNRILIDYYSNCLLAAAAFYGFELDLSRPVNAFTTAQHDLLFFGVDDLQFRRHFPGIKPPKTASKGRFEGVATSLLRRHAEHIEKHIHEMGYHDPLDTFLTFQTCPDCSGTRLCSESRSVTLAGKNIITLAGMPLNDLNDCLTDLPNLLLPTEIAISHRVYTEVIEHIQRVIAVGLGYLTLHQPSPSLSFGELQRLRLAALLSSGLTGVVYIFDEPTIGMHPRDTQQLIDILKRLRDLGNTVLLVEHDLTMIRSADHVIDMGPGGGKHGGQVIAAGQLSTIINQAGSLTGDYLAGRKHISIRPPRQLLNEKAIIINGAHQNNLKHIDVTIPLDRYVVITGVSGSGKSSLIFEILDRAAHKHFYGSDERVGAHDRISGFEYIDKLVSINQESIGRIPRSNVATYTDIYTPIRQAFAATYEAHQQGLTLRNFSFNTPSNYEHTVGRCERCEGLGMIAIKMHFLPDEEVKCPVCHGKRFTMETLSVKYHGYDISQVLEMTIEEALELFHDQPAASSRLKILSEIGLGYLQLGQPATTLSGGEAQRIKLAKELGRRAKGNTLYLLDEPTTGLHIADIALLLNVIQQLVDSGNSIVVIEHNLELIKTADWVIDLGPEGGAAGGNIVTQGTPEQVAGVSTSYTGKYLREVLE